MNHKNEKYYYTYNNNSDKNEFKICFINIKIHKVN